MIPLLLSRKRAAAALSMSVDSLERHVLPDLRLVRRGRLVLIPVAELEKWVARSMARTLEADK